MSQQVIWYDSIWLNTYYEAKEIISKVCPRKLDEFVHLFDIFRTDPNFSVIDVPELFGADQLATIKEVIKAIPMQTMELHEMKRFGRFVVHNHSIFTQIQEELTNRVSALVGEAVEPSYNFLSLYSRMGVCEPHLDAPSAKWTLDICIDQSEPWPIYFSQIVDWPEEPLAFDGDWQTEIKNSRELKFQSKSLMPGDAIIFSGSSQWHYRDPIPKTMNSGMCELLFFHYIPRGSADILEPRNWARMIDVPELTQIKHVERAA